MVDAETMEKLEAGFEKLNSATLDECKSYVKRHLTKEIFDELKDKKTELGATLLDVINAGVMNLKAGGGLFAPDVESYKLYAPLFDPIIEEYHRGFKPTDNHPPKDFGDLNYFKDLDPDKKYIISTRVRCGRSHAGYPFNPMLTEDNYKELENKMIDAFNSLKGDLKGTYHPLTGMDKEFQQKLIDDHYMYRENDEFLVFANTYRFWPTGRGIFLNDNQNFIVWVNEEDHMRIISMQKGGNLGQVYRRWAAGLSHLGKQLDFGWDDHLGYLAFCPTNLGTSIRASVHIKLPKLSADPDRLKAEADRLKLQLRGSGGYGTENKGGVYDISNMRRMGLTEFEIVKEMQDGILELIQIEESL